LARKNEEFEIIVYAFVKCSLVYENKPKVIGPHYFHKASILAVQLVYDLTAHVTVNK